MNTVFQIKEKNMKNISDPSKISQHQKLYQRLLEYLIIDYNIQEMKNILEVISYCQLIMRHVQYSWLNSFLVDLHFIE